MAPKSVNCVRGSQTLLRSHKHCIETLHRNIAQELPKHSVFKRSIQLEHTMNKGLATQNKTHSCGRTYPLPRLSPSLLEVTTWAWRVRKDHASIIVKHHARKASKTIKKTDATNSDNYTQSSLDFWHHSLYILVIDRRADSKLYTRVCTSGSRLKILRRNSSFIWAQTGQSLVAIEICESRDCDWAK